MNYSRYNSRYNEDIMITLKCSKWKETIKVFLKNVDSIWLTILSNLPLQRVIIFYEYNFSTIKF